MKRIILSGTISELFGVCYELNKEITNLVHNEIWFDRNNFKIEVTYNAMEKIMYYLSPGFLKDRFQHQINRQIK